MGIVKGILIAIFIVVSLVLIVLALLQTKDDGGASSTITGGSGNFYEKNKGNTREGRLKKWTIILGIAFAVLAVIISIIYAM